MQKKDKKQKHERGRKREKGDLQVEEWAAEIRLPVQDEDDLPGCLAREAATMRSKTTPSASHNQGGSNLSAGDKIHTHITWMDADGNSAVRIDELVSSLEPLLPWALLPLRRRWPVWEIDEYRSQTKHRRRPPHGRTSELSSANSQSSSGGRRSERK